MLMISILRLIVYPSDTPYTPCSAKEWNNIKRFVQENHVPTVNTLFHVERQRVRVYLHQRQVQSSL